VVGAGFIAERHMSVLAGFDDVVLVGVADVDVGRAEALARRFGVRPFAGHRELLDHGDLDAVYVCVPPFAHGEIELAAIERDVALFVEKPLAFDLATAEAVGGGIAARGLVTATGYHWRYLDIVEQAADLLAGSVVHLALGYWLDVLPPPAWWAQRAQSGGQLVEQTTHLFDLARLLVGEIVELRAEASCVERPDFAHCDIDWATTTTLRFAGGALGCVASTCVLQRPHRIGLHLFGDRLALELSETELVVGGGEERSVVGVGVNPFVREDRDFVDAVWGRADRIRVPYREALATHRVATAAARATLDGVAVRLGCDHV